MRKKRAYILLALLALLLLSSQCREAAELGSSCYDLMRCDRCVSQGHSKRADTSVSALRLSKKPVIASQSADWRGNPFSKHMIFAL